jgi:hypothetical protein
LQKKQVVASGKTLKEKTARFSKKREENDRLDSAASSPAHDENVSKF